MCFVVWNVKSTKGERKQAKVCCRYFLEEMGIPSFFL